MSKLSEALAAMDKATPGPWMVRRDDCHFDTMTEIYNGGGIIAETNHEQDTAIIAAAPALVRRVQELEDWQAKALPWLRGYKKFVSGERITHLSTLIEQAEVGSMAGLPGGFYG